MEPFKVLIVDDEPGILLVLRRKLEAVGCDARLFSNAESALAAAAEEPFDAIVSDIVLPGITGFEAIERFRRVSAAPVVLMSGGVDEEMVRDAVALGAVALVGKLDGFEALMTILSELRSGKGR
ncbi:MAG: hypothetical protein AUJ52_14595 [Elusimicrobia bacterium CG1_02_63_36]|nr:MAG: hypothetical protein AUJ52_14595 [Elusimicrobia bacterium CG1_02_63_36]